VTLIEESGRRHVIFDDMVSLTEGEGQNPGGSIIRASHESMFLFADLLRNQVCSFF
jgi:hypothetical protein